MTEKPALVPKGYHTVTPWIIAKGADGLVDFIEKTFGGKEKAGSRILNADGLIGYVEVQLGDSIILLFWRKSRTNTGSMGQLLVDSRTDRRAQLAGDGKVDARPGRG